MQRFPSRVFVNRGDLFERVALTRSFAFRLAAISDDMLVIDQPILFHRRDQSTAMDFMAAPASLSRHLNAVAPPPRLFHSIHQPNSSILCLAATGSYIFGGRQSGDILVFRIHCRAIAFERTLRYTGLGSSFVFEKDDAKGSRGERPRHGVCPCKEMAFQLLWCGVQLSSFEYHLNVLAISG